ncbi:MAG: dTDP-4-dehydrorhamnose reductase [Alphaproteobacteria bacterium]|nr:dTDP-4-dehydrorhamnose reductase [Alphaproteobacteria bacterium]
MTRHRIMVLGAAGQVGQSIQHLASHKHLPENWDLSLFSRTECNITNPSMLRDAIQRTNPDLIINASGLTNVEHAERDENLAMATNFHAVAQMAAQCSALDIPIIHLSTDYVFDGREHTPYKPNDQMNPLNTYGGSKMMGEEALRHEHPWHVILRISSVFSAFRRNILTGALALIEEQEELRFVTDIVSTPTYALDVAQAIVTIGKELMLGKADGYGTFHLTGEPIASRFDFVEEVMKAYEPFTMRRPKLVATVCAEFPDYVRRPPYSVMDCAKIKATYGIDQKSWKDGIRDAISILHNAGRTPRMPR